LTISLDSLRETRPETERHLAAWVRQFLGVAIPSAHVCRGHSTPLEMFAEQVLKRPSLSLWHGPRGAGKSFLSAIDTHLTSRWNPRHKTRILGGSRAQSEQIYQAINEVVLNGRGPLGGDRDAVRKLLKTEATYRNGSEVSILAASSTSVRGPHVPSLKLDEVDEIDPDLRDAAFGMAMDKPGQRTSILMTSTWHNLDGPMAELRKRAGAGDGSGEGFPWHTFCVFEVLERCPVERSGPNLEACPACPIVEWCHADRHEHPQGLPKAKRSNGHYTINSLIQKAQGVSPRVFAADYLCLGPRADGLWFPRFDEHRHVSPDAEYNPHRPVHLAVDCGVFTGAVFYQVQSDAFGRRHFTVFADYLAEGLGAEDNARALLRVAEQRCVGRIDEAYCDPAGDARNPVGPKVLDLYRKAGLPLTKWPVARVLDGLDTVEAAVMNAAGEITLWIHPRCRDLIRAFLNYRRAKRGGQWTDKPEDPQHPHEDLMDALRGGMVADRKIGAAPRPKAVAHRTSQANLPFEVL